MFHKLNSIDRQCEICGIKLLKEKLKPMIDSNEYIVKWNEWVVVKTTNPKTRKETTKRIEVESSGTPAKLIEDLRSELKFLSVHLFEAQWQQQQFAMLNKCLPEKSISLTIDFAQNYTCFAQNEIQGAHWAKDAVTIHPCIAQYRCPKDNELVDECMDIISDDLVHDSHAVHTFTSHIINHLREDRQLEFEKAFIISDGCGAQYKSKIPLMDVSCSLEDFQITIERCFYGSRHGKNRCDGEAGVLKSKATRLVKNRKTTIHDAKQFYESVKVLEKKPEDDNCMHKLRTVLFIGKNGICHNRPHRDSKTVPGTRKIHSVIGINRGTIWTRRLSCFCTECLQNRFDQCLMKQYVEKWKKVIIATISVQQEPVSDDQVASISEQPRLTTEILPELEIDSSFDALEVSFTSNEDSFHDRLDINEILTSLEDQDQRSNIKPSQFVLVQIPLGKTKFKNFVAEVIESSDDEIKVKYMAEESKGLFYWPSIEDTSWERKEKVQRILPLPDQIVEKSTNRKQLFKFQFK